MFVTFGDGRSIDRCRDENVPLLWWWSKLTFDGALDSSLAETGGICV